MKEGDSGIETPEKESQEEDPYENIEICRECGRSEATSQGLCINCLEVLFEQEIPW